MNATHIATVNTTLGPRKFRVVIVHTGPLGPVVQQVKNGSPTGPTFTADSLEAI